MATIETMTMVYRSVGVQLSRVFNLGAAVGRGAPNRPADVMLIQAMFKAIALEFRYYFMNLKLPDPNGMIEHDVLKAIWSYQSLNATHLLAVDGRIDPASFAGRTLHMTAKKETMMQFLNEEVRCVMTMRQGGHDHATWLMNMFPQLRGNVIDTAGSAAGNVA